jgi:hypothetical protein
LSRRRILLLIIVLIASVALCGFWLIESFRVTGEYTYGSGWVTYFAGHNPITSPEQAKETYLMLIDKAPQKGFWIYDNDSPLKLEALDMNSYYKVNGTFRNYGVNSPFATLEIVYNIFKNGAAELKSVVIKDSGYAYQEYPRVTA